MKIAHIIDTSLLGGAERMAISLANCLAKSGQHQVTLIISRMEGEGSRFLDPKVKKVVLGKQRFTDWSHFRQFVELLRAEKFDVIHAHTNSVYWALLAKLSFCPGLKIIWHDHYGNRPQSSVALNALWFSFSRMLSGYISISKPVMDWASKHLWLGSGKLHLLPNFPVLDAPIPSRVEFFRSRAGSPTFLMLGNFRPEKDHLMLLRAFQLVVQQLPQAKLWLAGKTIDAAYKKEVEEFIGTLELSEAVVDWGAVSDTANIIDAADIGVFASRFEGLPVSLLEFGLAGKPVVATSVGDIPVVLGHGKWGALAEPGKPDHLAAEMIELGHDQTKQLLWAQAFNSFVKEQYNQDAVILQLEQIYKEVVRQ